MMTTKKSKLDRVKKSLIEKISKEASDQIWMKLHVMHADPEEAMAFAKEIVPKICDEILFKFEWTECKTVGGSK